MTTVLIALTGALTLAWVVFHIVLNGALRRDPFLRADERVALPEPVPRVSVIIPARDEAANIGCAVAALLAQDYPRLEVIVVDDRSTDDTARIVREIAAGDARVRLLQNLELPAEWVGKAWVLQKAAAQAHGEILLFLDADVTLDPGALRVMVRHLVDHRIDLLTMILRSTNESVWDAVYFVVGGILLYRFRLGRVNDPRGSRAFANGQNLMIRADVYRDINGHEEVKSVVQEDIALARMLKRRGLKPQAVYGFDMGSARWYRRASDAWRGWTRILYGLFEGRVWEMLYGLVLVAFIALPLPMFVTAAAVLATRGASAGTLALFALGTLLVVVSQWLMLRLARNGRCRPVYVLLTFPACLVALGIFVWCVAMRLSSRSVVWRGKRYEMRAS